jgi:hypothetical protein
MDRKSLSNAVENGNMEWQRHALERMLEREISRKMVKSVLLSGEIVEEYSDDEPYPSALFLGCIEGQPLHVVAAFDSMSDNCFVITTYKPDQDHFESDYKTRRSHGN